MNVLGTLFVGMAILVWIFIGFSLKKKYRYATLVFDMLRFFPILIALSLVIFGIGIFVWLDVTSATVLLGISGSFCSVLFYYSMKWLSDYSTSNYKKFLASICTDQFSIRSFEDYVLGKIDPDKVNVFIRHDVDISLKRTLKIAEIEKKYNVYSTYFFRMYAEKYNFEEAVPVIKKLHDDTFGIGLHYETLSVSKGDKLKAIELLEKDIERLRNIAPISVVAAHGQKDYKNREIWENVDKNRLQISSAYDMKYDIYLSDAGGRSLRNKDGKYLFDRVYEAKPGQIVQVLVHPDWWI